ncbi:HAD family phosphatase [Miniimonas arenae]|uniref:HAD family phosphatase n=1 Tax=Miniimonas arenae TaxID=676201 RepID=A0A5C5BGF3_9MICO|nr:HAD family phosphatase [Miniimonas arenae]TNU77045.1 HAD family phosphatase [Miniimonas arenae]
MTDAFRTPRPAAILWDLDGTLVDTEPIWIQAETDFMASHGVPWSHEDGLTLVGHDLLVSAEIMRDRGVDLPPLEIARRLVGEVNARVERDGPVWRPGARSLVEEAHAAGIPQAIVTMSWRVQAEVVAAVLPAGAIGEIVAGDMVTRGKPDPEAYLRAAELFEVAITDCVAVEDSATGVQAAFASGARTVAVPYLVDVPARPGLARLSTLDGVDLAGLLAAAAGAAAAGAEDAGDAADAPDEPSTPHAELS